MTPQELLGYVETRMAMQHIYQPVLLRELLATGGRATIRQLARAYVLEDEELLSLVEERLKKMPLRVMKDNGIVTRHDHDVWGLTVPKLSHQDRETLRLACESRLRDFVIQRAFWEGTSTKMSGGTPGAVFKEAGYACAACRSNTKALQVDHIVPRSKQGDSSTRNLQALCTDCNLWKSDKHWIDFRRLGHAHRPEHPVKNVEYWWDTRPEVIGTPPM